MKGTAYDDDRIEAEPAWVRSVRRAVCPTGERKPGFVIRGKRERGTWKGKIRRFSEDAVGQGDRLEGGHGKPVERVGKDKRAGPR